MIVGRSGHKLVATNTTCGAITAIGQDRPFRDFGGGVVVSGRAYGITSLGNAIENDDGTFRCRNANNRRMSFTPIRRIETRLGARVRTVDPA